MSMELIFGFLCGSSVAFALCFGAVMYLAYKFADMCDEENGGDDE